MSAEAPETIIARKKAETILSLEKALLKLENLHASFDYIRLSIASPKKIKSWAQRTLPNNEIVGEVFLADTINFRTHEPEFYGLFCQKIFGPIKSWSCACGKYKGVVLDKVCENCHVELIDARVRRYRMGYIELTCPIAHYWYLKSRPNYLTLLLKCYNEELRASYLEDLAYFKSKYKVVTKIPPFDSVLYKNGEDKEDEEDEENIENDDIFLKSLNSSLLDKYSTNEAFLQTYRKSSKKIEESKRQRKGSQNLISNIENIENYKNLNIFDEIYNKRKRKGSEILKAALESIDIPFEINRARSLLENIFELKETVDSIIPVKELVRRIRVLESFLATKTNPGWMILTSLPVLPPDLRPLFELETGRLVASDLNEIYRVIISRNQRLFDLTYKLIGPDLVVLQGKKLLQDSVDCLIDNARLPKNKILSLNNKVLKSLTEILEGKQGRFRQSLLGKRVDYSGRSVIIVGPGLRLNQFGLPYDIAAELFQPFLINELLKTKIKEPSQNMKLASLIIRKRKPFVWSLLEKLTFKYSLLLNRAPTLHRFGIQAFDPILVLGQAIHLHPLVCTGFNADFDGDQMAVHLPLYESSQLEIQAMMKPSYNVLSPSNGEVILKPTQDMVIGCYYLTLMSSKKQKFAQKYFSNEEKALLAFYQKKISIHSSILVRYSLIMQKAQFEVRLENNTLKLYDNLFSISSKKIIIYKRCETGNITKKYCFLTNIGILIARYARANKYKLTDLFLETTPGRLIFNTNLKNLLD